MEILAETTLWGVYIAAIILISLITLFCATMVFACIYYLVSERNPSIGDVIGGVIFLALTIFLSVGLSVGFKEGPVVEYTAIVTDYNEVYAQGYEIARHEGKLVILEKAKESR